MKELSAPVLLRRIVRYSLLLFVGGSLTGCHLWHAPSSLPGWGLSSKERKIVEQSINDPFPSPDEVGMQSE